MPLGMEVSLGPVDFVLDGDPAPPVRGTAPEFSVQVTQGLHRWRSNLAWNPPRQIRPYRCRSGSIGPKAENFTEFHNINVK